MTEREQQQLLRRAKRERQCLVAIVNASERLREDMLRLEKELYGLREANANLRVERDATDALLGEAMDRSLDGGAS
jgi:hypothetical protein